MLCPKSNKSVVREGPIVEFVVCDEENAPKTSAVDFDANLVPLTMSKDILGVDYDNLDVIQHKLFKDDEHKK